MSNITVQEASFEVKIFEEDSMSIIEKNIQKNSSDVYQTYIEVKFYH